jgi:hypothetical protein
MQSTPGSADGVGLPAGCDHPHASEEARQDDRDEMDICLEPPQFVTGLARVPRGIALVTAHRWG